MFYSQCLISRTGPLKPIWIAAYCLKKLKKSQVAATDIPSSIDEIMQHEVTITYRVLGYLLLGVVRIYSKKVEYLYHDCNEVLTQINTSVPFKPNVGAMCAPYSSITLPERFELDGFVLELPEDVSREHMVNHQLITLEERREDFVSEYHPFDNYYFYHGEDPARFETSFDVHTPVREALSPHTMDIDTDMEAFHRSRSQASLQNIQDNQFSREDFPDFGANHGAVETVELEVQVNEVDREPKRLKFLEITPPDPKKSGVPGEGDPPEKSEITPPDPDFGANHGADETVELEVQVNEVDREPKRLKFLEITPPDPEKSGFPGEGDLQANAKGQTPQDNNVTYDKGACTSEIVAISTPGKKEQPRFSRKRKHLYDDTIVLSNEVMRRNLHDSTDLIARRGEAPVAALDVWKAYKLPRLQNFWEPMIPCAEELKTFYKSSVGGHPLEAPGGHIVVGEDQPATQREPIEESVLSDEALPGVNRLAEKDKARSEPPQERYYSSVPPDGPTRSDYHQSETLKEPSQEGSGKEDLTWNSAEPPTTSTLDVGPSMSSVHMDDGDQTEIDAQNARLDLTYEVVRQEDTRGNEDGWSVRTSSWACLLRKFFVNQKDHSSTEYLSMAPILEGRTRRENARAFYELLVLKSRGYVDVKQDTPYGDICLLSTPKLMSTF